MEGKATVNKNITLIFWSVYGLFIFFSFMYAFGHSSGGEAIGMFFGLFWMYIIDVLFIVIMLIFKRDWFPKNWHWFIIYFGLISFICIPISSNLIKVFFQNRAYRQKMAEKISYYEPVSYSNYRSDSAFIKSLFPNDSVILDTLIYSHEKNKIIGFMGTKEDTSVLYPKYNTGYGFKNWEIFIEKKTDKLYIHHPSGGNYLSQDSTIQSLRSQLVRWYYVYYSFDEKDQNSIWTDQYLWSKNIDTIKVK